MSTRTIKVGGIYALTSKRKGSEFKMVVRACRQLDQPNFERKIVFQDFETGDVFKYLGNILNWISTSEVIIDDLWPSFNVEFLGSDLKNLFRFAYQNVADKL